MAEPVKVEFSIGGLQEVERAFKTVEQSMMALERLGGRSAQNGADARVKVAKDEAKAKAKEDAKAAKAAEKTERERVKAAEKATRDKIKLAEAESKAKQKLAEADAKAAERAAAKEARDKVAAVKSAEREVAQIQQRARAEAKREHERAMRDSARWVREEAKTRQDARDKLSRGTLGAVGKGIGGAASMLTRGAMGVAGSVAQLGGGFSLTDSVQQRLSLERAAVKFSNSVNVATGKRPDKNMLMGKTRALSSEFGLDEAELLAGAQSYVAKSSDYAGLGFEKGADGKPTGDNLEFFAKIAKGTGTSFDDVAGAAGILRSQNDKLDSKGMKAMLLSIIGQGGKGSVEIENLAHVAGSITKSATAFQGDQAKNQTALLGMAQLAMKTSGTSPNEAATVVSNIASDVFKHQDKLGFAIDKKTGSLKDPTEVVREIMEKSQGQQRKLQQMGIGLRSVKFFQALTPDFQRGVEEAEATAKASGKKLSAADRSKAGAEAVAAKMRDVIGATYDEKSLNKDVSEMLNTDGEKLDKAFRDLRNQAADKLVPELQKLIPHLQDAIPKFGEFLSGMTRLIDWVSQNPWKGLGLLVAGNITKELAKGMIGDAVKSALTRMLSSAQGPGGALGAGGSRLGNGLAITAGIGLAVATGDAVIDSAKGGTMAGANQAEQMKAELINTRLNLEAGKISPEQAREKIRQAKGLLATAEDKGTGFANGALAAVSAPLALVSGGAKKDIAQYNAYHQVADQSDEIKLSMDKLAKSIDRLASSPAAAKTNPDAASRTVPLSDSRR